MGHRPHWALKLRPGRAVAPAGAGPALPAAAAQKASLIQQGKLPMPPSASIDPARPGTAAAPLGQKAAELQGRLGAFEKHPAGNQYRQFAGTLENVTSSENDITDADFAAETANLTRDQILVQAGTTVLATANNTPQNVFTLLQGH